MVVGAAMDRLDQVQQCKYLIITARLPIHQLKISNQSVLWSETDHRLRGKAQSKQKHQKKCKMAKVILHLTHLHQRHAHCHTATSNNTEVSVIAVLRMVHHLDSSDGGW